MTPLALSLQRAARHLEPHRDALVDVWMRELADSAAVLPSDDLRGFCTRSVEAMLARFAAGEAEELLRGEAEEAQRAAEAGTSFQPRAAVYAVLDRCCMPFLIAACEEREALAESLLALDELGRRRLEIFLKAQEDAAARRLAEAQEQGARSLEKAKELARANEALRKSEAESQRRAEQIALLSTVIHRMAPVLEPERLMQVAAETIQGRMNHTYVAVVVLDNEGVLVGRWAGRAGVGRRSAGRAQGPAGGVIGRALRKRAPQVVNDVDRDPDYHPDVPGTRSEMVIPLLDGGEAVGAIDFQTERAAAFDLDEVAVGEILAEFLVVALRNARLFSEARRERD
jgi:putative methionine-R-sulfoxide reductase with GAF domain